jgi:hypothetical protein
MLHGAVFFKKSPPGPPTKAFYYVIMVNLFMSLNADFLFFFIEKRLRFFNEYVNIML